MLDFERGNERRISSETVETEIELAIIDESIEIGIGAVTSQILRPRRAPGKDQSALDGSVKARRV